MLNIARKLSLSALLLGVASAPSSALADGSGPAKAAKAVLAKQFAPKKVVFKTMSCRPNGRSGDDGVCRSTFLVNGQRWRATVSIVMPAGQRATAKIASLKRG